MRSSVWSVPRCLQLPCLMLSESSSAANCSASSAGVAGLLVDEAEHSSVERIVRVPRNHVMRAGDVDELGVRHHFEKLASAGFADDPAATATDEQGRDVDCACHALHRI